MAASAVSVLEASVRSASGGGAQSLFEADQGSSEVELKACEVCERLGA